MWHVTALADYKKLFIENGNSAFGGTTQLSKDIGMCFCSFSIDDEWKLTFHWDSMLPRNCQLQFQRTTKIKKIVLDMPDVWMQVSNSLSPHAVIAAHVFYKKPNQYQVDRILRIACRNRISETLSEVTLPCVVCRCGKCFNVSCFPLAFN